MRCNAGRLSCIFFRRISWNTNSAGPHSHAEGRRSFHKKLVRKEAIGDILIHFGSDDDRKASSDASVLVSHLAVGLHASPPRPMLSGADSLMVSIANRASLMGDAPTSHCVDPTSSASYTFHPACPQ